MIKTPIKIIIISIFSMLILTSAIFFSIKTKQIQEHLISLYKSNQSNIVLDRNGKILKIDKNTDENYLEYINSLPPEFTKYLIQKEDKLFYLHGGINPKTTITAFFNYYILKKKSPSSTITQQLVKILLKNENNRTIENKIKEILYTISLENYINKKDILLMYENSIYFGNKIQGIKLASLYYFNTTPDLLNKDQIASLLATISNPSYSNPFTKNNETNAKILKNKLNLNSNEKYSINIDSNYIAKQKNNFKQQLYNDNYFEIKDLLKSDKENIKTTIDSGLTDRIRDIAKRNIETLSTKKATNAGIVVIKYPENEILSITGTIDPKDTKNGAQINMAIEPRPIGSTIKPFIYTKGFENNLRPYTMVDDKEYKYLINDNFAFYPKNYDYQYRGLVNLHYALSNSLNVPTVKVLEYIGIEKFYNFLTKDLEFKPTQDIANYQLGIALGGLEMNLLTLSYYFSIFSHDGNLIPLKLFQNNNINLASTNWNQNKKIYDNKYVELTNKILSDRKTGVDQFGLASDLNLEGADYALKTGTSREFHDSYTIGYTKDFLVAVWVGNTNNTAMDEISGQTGAGKIWHEVMTLLINSEYNKNNKFDFKDIKEYKSNNDLEYGLPDDKYENYKNLLQDQSIILKPHNNDEFKLESTTQIPLKSDKSVKWYIDGEYKDNSKEYIFQPTRIGKYEIKAIDENNKIEIVNIYID